MPGHHVQVLRNHRVGRTWSVAGSGPRFEHTDLDQNVLWRLLGILDEHIEVTIVVEDTRIQKLVFHLVAVAPSACGDQVIVGEGCLWILVQVLHVRVRRRAVEVEVILFDILAVVAFAVRQPEETLLEYWILAIPQTHAEAEQLFVIADTGKTIFAPVIGAGASLVVAEVIPGISISGCSLRVLYPTVAR